jgi:hypothetical protein
MIERGPERPAQSKKEEFPSPTISLEEVKRPEDFLAAIDWRLLNGIFDEIARKSGLQIPIEGDSSRWTGPDDVIVYEGYTPEMLALQKDDASLFGNVASVRDSGEIEISWKTMIEATANMEANSTLVILHSLIHEMTHKRAHNGDTSFEESPTGSHMQQGYKETDITTDNEEKLFVSTGVSLDEAVTEAITHEVYIEYLRRVGLSRIAPTMMKLNGVEGITTSYELDRAFLNIVIADLSALLKVHPDEVWRGFVAGYFNNDASTKELVELIDETLRNGMGTVLSRNSFGSLPLEEQKDIAQRLLNSPAAAALRKATLSLNPAYVRDALRLS